MDILETLKAPFQGHPSSGNWLYKIQILDWITEPKFKQQLPPDYQKFSDFCTLQKKLGLPRVLGGKTLHSKLINRRQAKQTDHSMPLTNTGQTIFLNLLDPRMLQVPSEVWGDEANVNILKDFLSPGDTFIDVGANHGSFSLMAATLLGKAGKIIAVEPQPRLASLVRKTIAANAECDFAVHEVACGESEGEVTFYVPEGNSGTAGIFPGFSAMSDHQTLTVPLKRFDDLVNYEALPGNIFIKLDVEGSEVAFLKGATKIIEACKPNIFLEVNPMSIAAASSSQNSILEQLMTAGYQEFSEVQNLTQRFPISELLGDKKRDVVILSP